MRQQAVQEVQVANLVLSAFGDEKPATIVERERLDTGTLASSLRLRDQLTEPPKTG